MKVVEDSICPACGETIPPDEPDICLAGVGRNALEVQVAV